MRIVTVYFGPVGSGIKTDTPGFRYRSHHESVEHIAPLYPLKITLELWKVCYAMK